jgi:lipopolysaccharide/colanic/teichoic acid biosynthesis glycosyltransferase
MSVQTAPDLVNMPTQGSFAALDEVLDGRRFYTAAKRVLDLTASVAALVALAPLWALIVAAIKLDSRGPALFRQVRIGRHGEPFVMFKFRSMQVDNDDTVHRRYIEALISEGAPAEEADGKPYFKLRNDPRVTRVGWFLRKTSLDELPQLLNVVRGEMSLVGPRPPLLYEVEKYQPWQLRRLAVKPGITGLWQVYGRSRVSFDEVVRMDVDYISRASLALDLKLILLTVPAMIAGAD